MKAKAESYLKEIENDPNLVVSRKWNGYGVTITVKNGKATVKCTRTGADFTANVPHITGVDYPVDLDIEIMCEGVAPSDKIEDAKSIFGSKPDKAIAWQREHGYAQFKVFNLLRWNGKDYSKTPYAEARNHLPIIVSALRSYGLPIDFEVHIYDRKHAYYKDITTNGGEGVVVKKLDGYIDDWVKVKPVNTYDAIITGFTDGKGKYIGLIGAIKYGWYDAKRFNCYDPCSIYAGGLLTVGKVSGMRDQQRIDMTAQRAALIGKVVEIKGSYITKKGAIVFPRFVRVRDDKPIEECTKPEE